MNEGSVRIEYKELEVGQWHTEVLGRKEGDKWRINGV